MESAQSINEIYKPKRWLNTLKFSKETIFILICAFVAFLLRFLLIPQETAIHIDSAYYATLGEKLISGDLIGGISTYWSPLYPFLIGVSSLFFQNLEFAGRFVSLIAGTLLVIPAYFLIRNFYGRVPAYYGTILIVIHPLLIDSSEWVLTESLYTLIFTTVVLMGWYALHSGKARTFFFTGLLLGAAYLTKPEAIGFLGLFFFLTLGAKLLCRHFSFRSLTIGYLLLLFGFTIFLLPYIVVVHHKTGYWTISQKLQANTSFVENERGNLELTDDEQITRKDQIIGDVYEIDNQQIKNYESSTSVDLKAAKFDFKEFVSKSSSNLKKEVREHIPTILTYPLILLIIVGFFYKPWTKFRTIREAYLFSFLICTLLGYAVAVTELRYLFGVIPILICWVSQGIISVSDWALKSAASFFWIKRKINPISVQIFVLIIAVASLMFSLFPQHNPAGFAPLVEKKAGLWIKNHKSSSALIMSSSPRVAFYAEENHLFLPDIEFTRVVEYAKRKKVDFLCFSEWNLIKTPKIYIPDEQSLPPELKLVYKDENIMGYKTVVYQLLY